MLSRSDAAIVPVVSQLAQLRTLVRRGLRVLRVFLPWIAVGAFMLWSARHAGSHAAFPVGSRLPARSVTLADGSTVPLSGSDSVVVLNFWASYCAPCRAEAPALSEAQAKAQGVDVRVVGLSVEALSPEDVTRQASRLGMHYGVGVADEALLSQLRVQSVPTTYVIAKSGKIVLSHVGALSQRELAAALEEASRDAS